MPKTKRPKPLYQRGDFKLFARADRANLEIVWYDGQSRRERGSSARTGDVTEAIKALDRRYLESQGAQICHACGRPFDAKQGGLVVTAIADYLIRIEGKSPSAGYRLNHVTAFVLETDPAMLCAAVNENTISRFREWMGKRTYKTPDGKTKPQSLSSIEGCVLQWAAAINASGEKANFKSQSMKSVSRTPQHRASVVEIAAMFKYAMAGRNRGNLLRYLRAAVSTMARPDAVMDIGNHRRQWVAAAKVLNLNPDGRRQTKKYRPTIPVAKQFAPHMDATKGFYIPVDTIRSTWQRMAIELGLPREGEAGWKLVRRSMATLLRNRLGEAHMPQIERMLGHRKESMTDIYALAHPGQLGAALAEIEAIIDEIEALAPGAFGGGKT